MRAYTIMEDHLETNIYPHQESFRQYTIGLLYMGRKVFLFIVKCPQPLKRAFN